MNERSDITQLLQAARREDSEVMDELMPLLYEPLRRIAHNRLRNERADHTLNTTDLVHEAYLKIVDIDRVEWQDRVHFLAVASRVMRRILVDYARKKKAQKRGGEESDVTFEEGYDQGAERDPLDERLDNVIMLDRALERLEELSPRQSKILELRYFGGMTLEETAAAVDVSLATVKRDLRSARAWLARELSG